VWLTLSAAFLVGMTTGAKVLYDVQHDRLSLWALFSIEHYFSGGLWGGVLAYLVLAVPTAWFVGKPSRPLKNSTQSTSGGVFPHATAATGDGRYDLQQAARPAALDLVALPLPIPMILTKLGCLFNGCCHGGLSSMPWAVTFPQGAATAPPGVPLHPTQTYEIVTLVGVLIVFAVLGHDRWRGTMLPWFLIVYGVGRAVSEIWRADLQDRALVIGGVSSSQMVCLVGAVGAALVLWRRRSRRVVDP